MNIKKIYWKTIFRICLFIDVKTGYSDHILGRVFKGFFFRYGDYIIREKRIMED